MAEEITQEAVQNEVVNEEASTRESTEQEQQEEMIPKSQMEEIIKARVAREQKAKEKAVEEAKRLAAMNEEEKRKYEYEQLQKELEEYKRKDQFYSLSKEASKMLSDNNIPADEEVFDVVVKDTAEATKERVEWFSGLVNRLVEEGVKKALSGKPPKVNTQPNKALDKEAFNKLSYTERVELKKTNPELYNQLTKGE